MSGSDEIKFNSKNIGLVLVILTIVSICASAVIAYAITSETAIHNSKDIEELKTSCKNTEVQVQKNTINVAILNVIAEDVKDIKQEIREINTGKKI